MAKKSAEEMLLQGGNQTEGNCSQLCLSKEIDIEPILFEECYVLDTNETLLQDAKSTTAVVPKRSRVVGDEESKMPEEGTHLFILVHGFQGHHNDLRGLKN